MASYAKVPVSVVIPTRNEERNLLDTLLCVIDWADEVVVFDSLSDDRTVEIAQSLKVPVVQRRFDNFSAHKNWALQNLELRNEWLLFLDADERLTSSLKAEIYGHVSNPCCSFAGFYIPRKNYFMGLWIKHAGMYPDWNLRLFRRSLGRYENRIVHEHVLLNGSVAYLHNPLEHNDFKGLARWLDRHNTYTSMEAQEIYRLMIGTAPSNTITGKAITRGPQRRRLMKELAYRYLPCRPFILFVWMYFVRAGFLDGAVGFRYCLLKATAEYLTNLKLLELREGGSARAETGISNAVAALPVDIGPKAETQRQDRTTETCSEKLLTKCVE
jgi:glycosyltransferase involved in cell wall biosynthesis